MKYATIRCVWRFVRFVQSVLLPTLRFTPLSFGVLLLSVSPSLTAAPSFQETFNSHKFIMLLIDPQSGQIVDANDAASQFYGYAPVDLKTMTIQQINQLSAEQVSEERKLAQAEGRNYFIFRHQIADGSIKTVEVSSVPLEFEGVTLLHSIVRDISNERRLSDELWHYQARLEEMVDLKALELEASYRNEQIRMIFAIALLFAIASGLIYALRQSRIAAANVEKAEQGLREVIWGTNVGTWEWNVQTGDTVFSERWADIIGYSLDELSPVSIDTWRKFAHPDDLISSEQQLEKVFKGSLDFYECEIRVRHRNGTWRWVQDRGKVVEWGMDGKPLRMSGTHTDITDKKNAEIELKDALSQLVATLEATDNGILVTSEYGRVIRTNTQFTTMWHLPAGIVSLGDEKVMLAHVKEQLIDPEQFIGDIEGVYESVHLESEDLLDFKDGRVFFRCSRPMVVDGRFCGRVWSFRDITEQRNAQEKIHRLAMTDTLTDLANRNQFNQRFEKNLDLAQREQKNLALMMVDLDKFKHINDTYGHPVGDAVLRDIANVLLRHCRKTDIVARLGGDEFAIVSVFPKDRTAAYQVAERIIGELQEPVDAAGHNLSVAMSIGICFYPDDAETVEDMIYKADVALYAAKKSGHNLIRCYESAQEVSDQTI